MTAMDGTKTCFKCGICQPLESFYKHAMMRDGRLNKCKACTKLDVCINRRDKLAYYREYDRQRANTPVRKDLRDRTGKRLRAEQPEKFKARNAVARAVRNGKLERQPCEVCGTTKRVHAHHDDYSKPLDVRWFCPKHHVAAHGGHFIKTLLRDGMTRTCCGTRISVADKCPRCGGFCK